MGQQAQNSRPGLPTWARQNANWAFGMDTDPNTGLPTGFLGQAMQSDQAFPWANYLSMLGAPLGAANQGGADQRQLASQLLGEALPGTQALAGQAMNAAGQGANLLGQIPNLWDSANTFAQNINHAGTTLQGAVGSANQTMQNVMDPTLYNPEYQNAMQNQIQPTINAQFSARGLGGGGAPIASISEAGTNLANDFAARQVQEQMQAQQTVGQLGNLQGQLGIQGAQVPGNVLGSFMQALGMGQQDIGTAMQNQLGPLGALTAGSQQFWQGVNNPLNAITNASAFTNAPMGNVQQGVLGALGNISGPVSSPIFKILGKQ